MQSMTIVKRALRWTAVSAVLAIAGCADEPPASDPDAVAEFKQTNDPLEPTNRAIFDFNTKAETYFLDPIARGYRYTVPPFGRDRVSDFLSNLDEPVVFLNDVLQGNSSLACKAVERFALNTTFGVFGIMDVATPLGIHSHEADFGQTLGVWGVESGPYLVLPFFGPSSARDGVGMGVDLVADPWSWYLTDHNLNWVSWARFGVDAVSKDEAYMDFLDDLRRTSLDYYAAMRSLSRQRREALIRAGKDDIEVANDRRRPDYAPTTNPMK
ncbi:MAG TPA: VacJ family lipoprotein [Magnetospirillaceae bacterium]|jgi:phospholipid-binding lipoprotein MlaA